MGHMCQRASRSPRQSHILAERVATQNILAVCDFDMCFVFDSCGWEGSMHDNRISSLVTEDPQYNFPTPVDDRYYLVDSGYSNKKGLLAPYKGNRYHQPKFQWNRSRNRDEFFNRAHSSLRSVIEWTFGAWKARWRFPKDMPQFDFHKVQVPLVAVSMALHNFIRRNSEDDELVVAVSNAAEYTYADMPDRADLAGLEDAMMPANKDIEFEQVQDRMRAE